MNLIPDFESSSSDDEPLPPPRIQERFEKPTPAPKPTTGALPVLKATVKKEGTRHSARTASNIANQSQPDVQAFANTGARPKEPQGIPTL